jgi:hypothetical protein
MLYTHLLLVSVHQAPLLQKFENLSILPSNMQFIILGTNHKLVFLRVGENKSEQINIDENNKKPRH